MRLYTASLALFHLGIGDYRIFVVDFLKELIMGDRFVSLCKPSMRRLISCQPRAVSNYLVQSEFLFQQHRIQEKVARIELEWDTLS